MTDAPALPARPDLFISPEPSPEEFAALAAALLLLHGEPPAAPPPAEPAAPWRTAARREGISGIAGGPRSGWGRPRGGWRA
ncbi:MAG: hypothetical protein ACKOWF_11020 [Chloroflexota bacterium]